MRRMTQPTAPATTATALVLTFLLAAAAGTRPAAADTGEGGGETTSDASSSSSSGSGSSRFGGGTFGTADQWVFSLSQRDEFPLQMFKEGGNDWDLLVQPSADYFIAPDVSVGGLVKFATNGIETDIGAAARGGYNVGFTRLLSLWLRGSLFFHRTAPAVGGSYTQTKLDVQAPLLVHLARHFFVGAGPFINFFLTRGDADDKPVTFGLRAILGGYL
jgi:hypothetical protein